MVNPVVHIIQINNLKHLSNFFRTHKMPLMNCEISLNLKWSKITQDAQDDNTEIRTQKHSTLAITKAKLWVPVFNLSPLDNTMLLQQ